MTAEDLRIGNWVHQGDGFAMQIVAIFQDEVYLNFEGNEGDVWESKIADLHGVEVNTEWLEGFGFKLSETKAFMVNGNFSYWVELDLFYWKEEAIDPSLTKYVHQIQNLHQSLIGIKI